MPCTTLSMIQQEGFYQRPRRRQHLDMDFPDSRTLSCLFFLYKLPCVLLASQKAGWNNRQKRRKRIPSALSDCGVSLWELFCSLSFCSSRFSAAFGPNWRAEKKGWTGCCADIFHSASFPNTSCPGASQGCSGCPVHEFSLIPWESQRSPLPSPCFQVCFHIIFLTQLTFQEGRDPV
jgi:hypothetical protein